LEPTPQDLVGLRVEVEFEEEDNNPGKHKGRINRLEDNKFVVNYDSFDDSVFEETDFQGREWSVLPDG